MAQAPGEVYLPQHGVVAGLAGKLGFAHLAAIDDVLDIGGPAAAELADEVRAALRQRRFALVVVDGTEFVTRFPELAQNYRVTDSLPAAGGFFSVSGRGAAPEVVYVPK